MTQFTVFGGTGFIGTQLVRRLRATGGDVRIPTRTDALSQLDLGTVFYCVGLTADFRARPFETVEAHVELLTRILQEGRFAALVYLSSTRIYKRLQGIAREDSSISVIPDDPDDLYGVSKAMGEAIGFASGKPFKAARLSNVYGPDLRSNNFLSSILRSAVEDQTIVLEADPALQRDYVAVDQVVDLLMRIAENGQHDVYNVASGQLVSSADIVDRIGQLTGCDVRVVPAAMAPQAPRIDITRVRDEFEFVPRGVLNDIPVLVDVYRRRTEEWQ